MIEKLMVVFVSSLDLRRINQNNTPYLYNLLGKYPLTRLRNIPEGELNPTLLTGRYPHEHGFWHVRLKSNWDVNSSSNLDYLPDILTTTSQCFIHLFTGSYDLAGVPPWRRRRFEIFKIRYRKRELKRYLKLNGVDTLFSMIGESNCNYIHSPELHKQDQIIPKLFQEGLRFELVESYGLDRLKHWFIDNQVLMIDSYNKVDGFVKYLHSECGKRGITLMIFSDHGHEVVKSSIDIIKKIHDIGIRKDEITYFVEAPKARFWFHSDSAREKVLNFLSGNPDGVLLSWEDMHKYNVKFEDDSFGEYYFILNPGTIFFPNDYYHPLGNLYLGLTEKQQRSRLQSPLYRGYHGYMPYIESQKGFLLLLDDSYNAIKNEIETIDFAPTILNLLGYDKPNTLEGVSAFDQ